MNNKKTPSSFKEPQLGRLKKDIINKYHPAVANKNFMDDRFMSMYLKMKLKRPPTVVPQTIVL
jgi:hypothetical protein